MCSEPSALTLTSRADGATRRQSQNASHPRCCSGGIAAEHAHTEIARTSTAARTAATCGR